MTATVLTQRNDNARSGANLKESRLNIKTVNAQSFGKLFSREVDGEVYTQPLYVPALETRDKNNKSQGVRNVIFVGTVHNSVYAFDADDPEANAPLWHVNFGPAVPVVDLGQTCGVYRDMATEAGIIGTPVIDAASKTLYVVARNKLADKTYHHRLHALDITTGREKLGAPIEITATAKGQGAGNVNGVLSFNAQIENQRAALLLLRGVVYITWASHCDEGPYHGWILGYDAKTLKQVATFNTTPNGWAGGVWQSGTGMSADAAGNLYMVTGNGTFNLDQPGGQDMGDTFIKLGTDDIKPATGKLASLKLLDWFTPFNQAVMLAEDTDLGSCGALLLHDERLIISGNKKGTMYAVPMAQMGGYNALADSARVQNFAATGGGHLHGTPVYWKSTRGPMIYAWGEQDYLKAWKVSVGRVDTTPASQSPFAAPPGMPGGFLSLSAGGDKVGTGIVWASLPGDRDANHETVPGVLRAFDATDVSKEVWNSMQNKERDDLGNFAKFCQPTIANGRVYLATFSNQIVAYGLNPPALLQTPRISPDGGAPTQAITLASPQAGVTLRYTLDESAPKWDSPVYSKQLKLKQCGWVKVRAWKKGFAPSPIASAFFGEPGIKGTGDGLSAEYFKTNDLTGPAINKIDATVDTQAPPQGIDGGGAWSARWTGQIQPGHSGLYTIYTVADDGIRVWLNGQKIIDDWAEHAATEDRAQIKLEAGKKYSIKIEYYNGAGPADAHLQWSSPCEPRGVIAQSQLYAK